MPSWVKSLFCFSIQDKYVDNNADNISPMLANLNCNNMQENDYKDVEVKFEIIKNEEKEFNDQSFKHTEETGTEQNAGFYKKTNSVIKRSNTLSKNEKAIRKKHRENIISTISAFSNRWLDNEFKDPDDFYKLFSEAEINEFIDRIYDRNYGCSLMQNTDGTNL